MSDTSDPGALATPLRTHAARSRPLGFARNTFVAAFAIGLAWFGRPSTLELALGFALTALGEPLRCWAAGYLVKSRELITGGPYRHVRNPLYLGRLLIVCGVCVAATFPYHANLWALAGALVVFFGYYMPRKERVEPERLLDHHGAEFARYREAVPSLIPSIRAYDRPVGRWTWASFARNGEPFMLAALIVFFGLLAARSVLG